MWYRRDERRQQEGDPTPRGGVYLAAVVEVAGPDGRSIRREGLVESNAVRADLTNLTAGLPHHHSGLQEPHGGEECVMPPLYSREPCPDGQPYALWRTLVKQDGRRIGRGALQARVRVSGSGRHAPVDVTGPVRECSLRADVRALFDSVGQAGA